MVGRWQKYVHGCWRSIAWPSPPHPVLVASICAVRQSRCWRRLAPRTRQPSPSGDMQRRSVISVAMGLHDDLHVLIQRHEKTQKALHGELPELSAQHLGYVGLADTQQISDLDLFQTPLFHDRVDLEH